MISRLDWLGALTCMAGNTLLSLKKRWCFHLFIISNLSYTIFAAYHRAWGMVLLEVYLVATNVVSICRHVL